MQGHYSKNVMHLKWYCEIIAFKYEYCLFLLSNFSFFFPFLSIFIFVECIEKNVYTCTVCVSESNEIKTEKIIINDDDNKK